MPNNNIKPETTQSPANEMTADRAMAALSFATMLSEGLMPKAPPEQATEPSQTLESAPGQEQTSEPTEPTPDDKDAKIADLEAKFEILERDVKNMIQEEMSGMREQIKQILEDKPEE
mgnify:CR=1 FL=1